MCVCVRVCSCVCSTGNDPTGVANRCVVFDVCVCVCVAKRCVGAFCMHVCVFVCVVSSKK